MARTGTVKAHNRQTASKNRHRKIKNGKSGKTGRNKIGQSAVSVEGIGFGGFGVELLRQAQCCRRSEQQRYRTF
jgi:hypothetical protein